jgi:hypothetical protein
VEPRDYPTIHYTELPPAGPDEPLGVEWEVYRRKVADWLAEGNEGRWVLVKGEEVIGIFDTLEAAREEAHKRYLMPRQAYLLRQILTRERMYRVSWMYGTCPTPP